jgi:4-amino-4-deoxy-L-arabinose transferase-like glycosyltransferase
MPEGGRRVPGWALILAGLVLLGLALRLWGIKYGLPFGYQTDEERLYVRSAAKMLDRTTLDPHYFMNPPAFTYLLIAEFRVIFGHGTALQYVELPARGDLFLAARLTAAVIGTGAIALTFFATRRFFGDVVVSLLAAMLMAVAFLPVFYSHVALDNVPAMTAALVSLIGTAAILRRGWTRDFVIAGAGLGLAAATKYLDGIVVVPLLIAALLAPVDRKAKLWGAAVALGVAFATFLICNPYALIDFTKFKHDLDVQNRTAGMEKIGQDAGGGIQHYLYTFGWGLGYIPSGFAILGAATLWSRDRRLFWVLVPVVPLFLIYMGLKTRYFGRWMLPAFPIVCMLAAYGAVRTVEWISSRRPALRPLLLGAAALALAAQSVVYVIHDDRVLSRPHTMNLARDWMVDHIPSSSKVIVEPLRQNVWRRPWPQSQFRLFGGGQDDPVEYTQYLSADLVGLYQRLGYCWVFASSDFWGPALADRDESRGAPGYYRALQREGTAVFSASPYGDVNSPVGAGLDKVPFGYDWSFDFYPMAYTRPGPAVAVYRLHHGLCATGAERKAALARRGAALREVAAEQRAAAARVAAATGHPVSARRTGSYSGTGRGNATSPSTRTPELRPRRSDQGTVPGGAGARPGADRSDS